ncbi:hypothetical protein FGB62_79g024 [Gracilaria domingensis]|nr:hypothetical protein FGB62_79g024 [Gracilaria domingensis]
MAGGSLGVLGAVAVGVTGGDRAAARASCAGRRWGGSGGGGGGGGGDEEVGRGGGRGGERDGGGVWVAQSEEGGASFIRDARWNVQMGRDTERGQSPARRRATPLGGGLYPNAAASLIGAGCRENLRLNRHLASSSSGVESKSKQF